MKRHPDLVIGTPEHPYLLRWHLLRWRGWQISLHQILRSDDDRALHDHVGASLSFILAGRGYDEWFSHAWEPPRFRTVRRWRFAHRSAATPHRLVLRDGPVWTLWIRAPMVRDWGFWCRQGWRHWRDYIAEKDYRTPGGVSTIGRGCD